MNAAKILFLATALVLVLASVSAQNPDKINFCNITLKYATDYYPPDGIPPGYTVNDIKYYESPSHPTANPAIPKGADNWTLGKPVEINDEWILSFEAYNITPTDWITGATVSIDTDDYEIFYESVNIDIVDQFFDPGGFCGSPVSKTYTVRYKTEDPYTEPGDKYVEVGITSISSGDSIGDFYRKFKYTNPNYVPDCGTGLITTKCWCEKADFDGDGDILPDERGCEMTPPPQIPEDCEPGVTVPANAYCCFESYSGTTPCKCPKGEYDDPATPELDCKGILEVYYTGNPAEMYTQDNMFKFELRVERKMPDIGPNDLELTGWIFYGFGVKNHVYHHTLSCSEDAEQCTWFPPNFNTATQTAEYLNKAYPKSTKYFASPIALENPGDAVLINSSNTNNRITLRDSGGLYRLFIVLLYNYTDPVDGTLYTDVWVDAATDPDSTASCNACGRKPKASAPYCDFSWSCYPRPKFAFTDTILYDVAPHFFYIRPGTENTTTLQLLNFGQVDWPPNPGRAKGTVTDTDGIDKETVWVKQRIFAPDLTELLYQEIPLFADPSGTERLPFADPNTCGSQGWDPDWCEDPNAERFEDISFTVPMEDYKEFMTSSDMLLDIGTWKTSPITGQLEYYKLDKKAAWASVARLIMINDETLSCYNPSNSTQSCDCNPASADSCKTVQAREGWGPCYGCYLNNLTDTVPYGQTKSFDLLLRNPLDIPSNYALGQSPEPFISPLGDFAEESSLLGASPPAALEFTTYLGNAFTISVPAETSLASAKYYLGSASELYPTIGDEAALTINFASNNLKITAFYMCQQGVGGCVETGKSFYSSEELAGDASAVPPVPPTEWRLKVLNEGSSPAGISGQVVLKDKSNGVVCTWPFSAAGVPAANEQEFGGDFTCSIVPAPYYENGTYTLKAEVAVLPNESIASDNSETLYFTVGGREIAVPDASPLTALVVVLIVFYLVVRK